MNINIHKVTAVELSKGSTLSGGTEVRNIEVYFTDSHGKSHSAVITLFSYDSIGMDVIVE